MIVHLYNKKEVKVEADQILEKRELKKVLKVDQDRNQLKVLLQT